MANKKVTDLTALTSADSNDVLPIVDVSANTTKKVTVDGLIAAGSISTTKLADDAVTPAKAGDLAAATNRKNHTTSTVVTDQLIQTGWGFMAGTGAAFVVGSITFPVAFDSAPILVVGSLGRRDGADPATISDFNLDSDMWAHSNNITATGAGISIESVSATAQSSGRRMGFSWIAIGTKAR